LRIVYRLFLTLIFLITQSYAEIDEKISGIERNRVRNRVRT